LITKKSIYEKCSIESSTIPSFQKEVVEGERALVKNSLPGCHSGGGQNPEEMD